MGSSESKNINEVINETVQKVIFETIQNCKGPISQDQIVQIKNSKNIIITDVTMNQYASVNIQCAIVQTKSVDFQNKLEAALTQMAEAEAPAITTSKVSSENVNKTINKITQEVSDKIGQDCITSISQTQAILVDSSQNVVMENIKFSQFGQATIECMMNNNSYVTSVNDLQLQIDQQAKSKISLLGDLGLEEIAAIIIGSSFLSFLSIMVFVIIIIVLTKK